MYQQSQFKKLFLTSALLAACLSCGKKKDSTSGIPSLVNQSQTASTLADEGTDAVAEGGSSGGSALTENQNLVTDLVFDKTCTLNSDGQAVVAMTVSGESTKEKSVTRRVGTVGFSAKTTVAGTETRTWTKASTGSALTCNAGKNVKVGWNSNTNVDGLKMEMTVDRSRTVDITKTLGVVSQTSSIVYTVKGSRSLVYASAAVSGNDITVSRTVTIKDMARTVEGASFDGSAISASVTVSTATDAPLAVDVVRDVSDSNLTWKTKTIKSGTLIATFADGSKVDSKFENVLYSKSADNVCLAQSGTISGNMYGIDGATVAHTYKIEFSASGATKTVDGEEDPTYIPSQSCDLTKE